MAWHYLDDIIRNIFKIIQSRGIENIFVLFGMLDTNKILNTFGSNTFAPLIYRVMSSNEPGAIPSVKSVFLYASIMEMSWFRLLGLRNRPSLCSLSLSRISLIKEDITSTACCLRPVLAWKFSGTLKYKEIKWAWL